MLVKENIEINGKSFIRTYSSKGCYVEIDGIKYSDAIDVEDKEYTETNEKIVVENNQQEDNKIEDEINSLKEQNELLVGCILEMADIIYA